jgi:serine protease AprX
MNSHLHKLNQKTNRIITLALIVVLVASSVSGGITYAGTGGVDLLGLPGLIDLLLTGVNSARTGQASGITATSPNGLTILSNGRTYQANSVLVSRSNGITFNALDNLNLIRSNGISLNTLLGNGTVAHANQIIFNAINGFTITQPNGITFNGLDGAPFTIPPGNLTILGASHGSATDVSNINFTGANTIRQILGGILGGTGLLSADAAPTATQSGLQSDSSSLLPLLDGLTDDSNVNAAVVYYNPVTNADISTLRLMGVLLGQRYHVLPIVTLTATKAQIMRISQLPTVRAIYSNSTLKLAAEPGNGLTGTESVKTDPALTAANGGQPVNGSNVTVAVLDTGLDSTHGDLSGRVVRNALTVGVAGLGITFNYPITVEGIPNTDLVAGHGTFVGGVIAGKGARSSGRYTGVAPGAKLVGVSVGNLDLISVIEGFDYILWKRQELGIKVVNCSFSANIAYNPNDPVNIASKMLTDRGVSVVFSAGNSGPGLNTLNPYAMAPWVVSVGATDAQGKLANFSSRGSSTTSGPSLVAPGVNVISLRATGVNVNGLLNLGLGGDLSILSAQDLLYYTVGSGTSFSAPQVTGTIAMMLDANPSLTPAQIKNILQSTATPLPSYNRYEVGAGMLNAHAAVLKAAFPQQARYVNDPLRMFSGTVPLELLGLLGSSTSNVNIPPPTGESSAPTTR